MGRTVDLDDLASAGVVAARLGQRRIQNIHYLMNSDPTCPRPIVYFSRTAVWLWPEMREWALDHGWQRWTARPTAKRVLIEPPDRVPAGLITERLGIDMPPDSADARGNHSWAEAEARWHRRINNA
jgi:hypothetical protein